MPKGDVRFIGENIRRLRRQAGLQAKQVARLAGIQPGPLSRIERGHVAPSARVLHAISRVLKVPITALFAGDTEEACRLAELAAGQPLFNDMGRKTDTDPVARDRADRLVRVILALEDLCGVPKHARIPLRTFLACTEQGMERLAGTVRDFMGIRDGVVFDYYELFEACGLRLAVCPFPPTTDGLSYYDLRYDNAFIFLNSLHTVERQLFRLAYELGLLYLQSAQMTGLVPADGAAAALKPHTAAQKFAACFLMPPAAVRATVEQVGVKPDQWTWELLLRLKHRFGVSAQTFLYRLNELEVIAPKVSKALDVRIKAHYAATGNSEPDDSRRRQTPNGRIWDLVLMAQQTRRDPAEANAIERQLKRQGVVRV